MIGEARAVVVNAIRAATGLGDAVCGNEPETIAAPAVWLDFTAARYDTLTGWEITFDATLVADAAKVPADVAITIDELLDAVLTMTAPGITAARMTARGDQTVRIGDVAHPAAIVTIPAIDTTC